MDILLNLFGILVVIYAIIMIRKQNKYKTEKEIEEFIEDKNNLKSIDEFDPDTFINDVNKFSEILEKKSRKENDNMHNKKIKDDLRYDKIKDIEDFEPVGYTNLIIDMKDKKKNLNNKHEKILDLQKIGFTKEEIAKQTNRSVREIEIILKIESSK